MQICDYDACTGCGACSNICPKDAISMADGDMGEIRPLIDEKCIECGRCIRVCPANQHPEKKEPLAVYAAWRTDKEKRRMSASGGVGAVFSEAVFSHGGYVVGTVFDGALTPVFKLAHTDEELEKFKGSKYVQITPGNIYRDVKEVLKSGKQVLFIGVSCQVSGLLNYLGGGNIPNLITVDLLCHGVCPSSYLKEHVDVLCQRYRLKGVDNVTFRSNIRNRNYHLTLWNKSNEIFHRQGQEDYYFRGFLHGLTLRESCYICQYKGTGRVSDITIGDFIGLGKEIPYAADTRQVSLILVNTEAGKRFLMSCSDSLNLTERTLEEALVEGPSLKHPFPKDPNREKFVEYYKKYGFEKSVIKLERKDIIGHFLQRCISFVTRRVNRILFSQRKAHD